jgi:hypothetical protein
MSLNEYNSRLLCQLRKDVAGFLAGELELDQIQWALQSTISLLENDGSGVADAIRLAEADVEEIRFTRLLDEQRPAVTFRLDELVAGLPREGDD